MKPTIIPESYALFPMATAPSDPLPGQVYLDGSVSPPVYKQWNSVTLAWDDFGGGGVATQAVAARAYTVASQAISNTVPVDYDTISFDTASAVTTGAAWKFTAPVAGIYSVSTTISPSSGSISIALYKNGTIAPGAAFFMSVVTSNGYTSGSTSIQLAAGDYIDVRSDVAGITIVEASISIALAAGVASGTTVSARASQAVTASTTALNVIAFDTVDFDSDSAMSAGVFTAPFTGYYQVSGMVQFDTPCDILLYKNGSLSQYVGFVHFANENCPFATLINLVLGDTIDVRPGATTNVNGISGTPVSYFNVARV